MILALFSKFLAGRGAGGIVFGGIGIVVLILLVTSYSQWKYNQRLEVIIAQKESHINALELETTELTKSFNDALQITSRIRDLEDNHRENERRLETRIRQIKPSGEVRDIGKISIAKPKLVEKIVSNATNNRLRCLELVTGSALDENEKKNNECPELVNPSTITNR